MSFIAPYFHSLHADQTSVTGRVHCRCLYQGTGGLSVIRLWSMRWKDCLGRRVAMGAWTGRFQQQLLCSLPHVLAHSASGEGGREAGAVEFHVGLAHEIIKEALFPIGCFSSCPSSTKASSTRTTSNEVCFSQRLLLVGVGGGPLPIPHQGPGASVRKEAQKQLQELQEGVAWRCPFPSLISN